MADADEGFEAIPAETEPPDGREELRLQDALADPQVFIADIEPPYPLGRAPAYDFAERRLIPGVAGGPLMTRGTATLATWVEKCLRTRRGENPAVDPDFGTDLLAEDLLSEGEPFDESAIAEYTAAIERALSVHPRISGIEDIVVEHDDGDDDAAFLTFTVVTDDDETPDVTFNRLPIGG